MKRIRKFLGLSIVLLFVLFFTVNHLMGEDTVSKPTKEEFAQKIQKLQLPFIANEGQVDNRVRFYANTFGGTVYVTKEGEIVYSLPQVAHASPLAHNEINKDKTGYTGLTGYIGKDDHCAIHRASCAAYPYCAWSFPVCHSERSEESQGRLRDANVRQIDTSPYTKNCQNQKLTPQSETRAVVLKEELVGGKISGVKGEGESATKVSYFRGNDPSKWRSGISTYGEVNLGEVYEGVELKLKAYGNNVEKLFCVKPDARPEMIRMGLSGCQSIKVNKEGELEVETELGAVKFTKPVAYQEIDGKRVQVECGYVITDYEGVDPQNTRNDTKINFLRPFAVFRGLSEILNPKSAINNPKSEYGFKVTAYDKTKDLIIDPLLASTYLGGSDVDYGNSLTLDTSGNVYVTGYTNSTDFPTTSGAYDTSYNRGSDVFVSKLDSGLTSLLASTYLGGSGPEWGNSLTLDTSGNVYVTGFTVSSNFPTTSGAYDTSWNGENDDVFVSKLDSGLTSLLASTYLGGSGGEGGKSLTLDTSGNIYVIGYTDSTDFPTTSGAFDTSYNGGFSDVFVSKLDSGLTNLLASTFLGGSDSETGNSLTLDTSGHAYVTGDTWSTNFPTTSGAYDTSWNGDSNDIFVSKLDSGLTNLLASTYLGGSGSDIGNSLTLDTSGNVYVTGSTHSTKNFPTTSGAYNTSYNGGFSDIFVSRLDSGLTSLLSSTYLGGSDEDYGNSLTLDTSGNFYVTGHTISTDFPTTSGAYDTSYNNGYDVFISKLDSGLTSLLASTYLGGSGSDERGNSLILDTSGNVYVTGYTVSTDFPTTSGAYDTSYNGYDVFVSKLDGNLSVAGTPTPTLVPSPTPAPSPTPVASPTPVISPTPVPSPTQTCEAANLDAAPEPLKLKIKESANETVTVTCENGDPVAGVTVTATVKEGKKRVSVSPSSKVTDPNGQAIFILTAKKTGKAKVRFEADGLTDTMTVKVR